MGDPAKALSIGYLPTDQTQAITNSNDGPGGTPEAVTMTWAGAGQAERVGRSWTYYDKNTGQSTAEATTYTWSRLGLAGYRGTAPGNATAPPAAVTSWLVRMPDGTPAAQRYSNGSEYYYLFDGQGDVVGLEDPGAMQAAYDFCPTGNEADLASTLLTAVALGNPLRMGAIPYDDLTKIYFARQRLYADYSGTGTQTAALMFGDDVCGAFEDAPDCGPLAPAPADPTEVGPGGAGELPSEPSAGQQVETPGVGVPLEEFSGVPQKAIDTLNYVQSNNGSAPSGYTGGRVYQNRNGALPAGGAYREYDVDPRIPGTPRNAERIVIDQNTGQAWYTSDHYGTFTPIK